jgi:hypothetical protein
LIIFYRKLFILLEILLRYILWINISIRILIFLKSKLVGHTFQININEIIWLLFLNLIFFIFTIIILLFIIIFDLRKLSLGLMMHILLLLNLLWLEIVFIELLENIRERII